MTKLMAWVTRHRANIAVRDDLTASGWTVLTVRLPRETDQDAASIWRDIVQACAGVPDAIMYVDLLERRRDLLDIATAHGVAIVRPYGAYHRPTDTYCYKRRWHRLYAALPDGPRWEPYDV